MHVKLNNLLKQKLYNYKDSNVQSQTSSKGSSKMKMSKWRCSAWPSEPTKKKKDHSSEKDDKNAQILSLFSDLI